MWQSLTYLDPLAGLRELSKQRKKDALAGNAVQVARADYVLSLLALFSSAKRGPISLAQRYRKGGDAVALDRKQIEFIPFFLEGIDGFRAAETKKVGLTGRCAVSKPPKGTQNKPVGR